MLVPNFLLFLQVFRVLQALPLQSLDGMLELFDVEGSIDDLLYFNLVDFLLILLGRFLLLSYDLMQVCDVFLELLTVIAHFEIFVFEFFIFSDALGVFHI